MRYAPILIAAVIVGGSAHAGWHPETPSCRPRHEACETAKKKAETSEADAEDYRQMKLACAAEDACERSESDRAAKAEESARLQREAAQRAAQRFVARLRKRAASENVKLRACGDREVRKIVRCVLEVDDEGCDADAVGDATDEMNGVATSDE